MTDTGTLGIISNFALGASGFLVALIVYDLLRNFYPTHAFAREYASPHARNNNYDGTPLHALPRPSSLPFSWIPGTILHPEETIAETHGLDVAMFLRFLSTQALLFGMLSAFTAVVLIPTYVTAGNRDKPETTNFRPPQGVEIASLSNVPDNSFRLWITFVSEIFVIAAATVLIYRDQHAFTEYRRKYRARPENPSNYAVLLMDVPDCDYARIQQYAETIFPASVVAVHPVRDGQNLLGLKRRAIVATRRRKLAQTRVLAATPPGTVIHRERQESPTPSPAAAPTIPAPPPPQPPEQAEEEQLEHERRRQRLLYHLHRENHPDDNNDENDADTTTSAIDSAYSQPPAASTGSIIDSPPELPPPPQPPLTHTDTAKSASSAHRAVSATTTSAATQPSPFSSATSSPLGDQKEKLKAEEQGEQEEKDQQQQQHQQQQQTEPQSQEQKSDSEPDDLTTTRPESYTSRCPPSRRATAHHRTPARRTATRRETTAALDDEEAALAAESEAIAAVAEAEADLDTHAPLTEGAIIVLRTKRAATALATAPFWPEAGRARVSRAPEPRGVNWNRIDILRKTSRARRFTTLAVLVGLALFWTIPATFIQGLGNFKELAKQWPDSFFANVSKNRPGLTTFLEGFLPPVLLFLLLLLVPLIMRFIMMFERIGSMPNFEAKLRNYLFFFYFMSNFVYTVLFGSFIKLLKAIFNENTNIIKLLSTTVPAQATFLMKYVLINAFLGSTLGMLNTGRLLFRPFARAGAKTDFERQQADRLFADFPFAKIYAICMMISLICFVYSTIAPIINVVAFGYFSIAYLCNKQLLLYSHRPVFEGGGYLFRECSTGSLVGLYTHSLAMIGIFSIKRATTQGVLMGGAFVFTLWFTFFLRSRFRSRIKHGSLVDQIKSDEELGIADEIPEGFADMYIHPGLKPLEVLQTDVDPILAPGKIPTKSPKKS